MAAIDSGYACGGELTTACEVTVTSSPTSGGPSSSRSPAEINAANGRPCRVSTTRSPPYTTRLGPAENQRRGVTACWGVV